MPDEIYPLAGIVIITAEPIPASCSITRKLSPFENGSGVLPAIGRVGSSDAPVIPPQRLWQRSGMGQVVCKYSHSVADVRLHIEQVSRSAAPLPCMEGHYLHEAPRANRTRRLRIEPRILCKKDPDQKLTANVSPAAFLYDRSGHAMNQTGVGAFSTEETCNVRLVAARRESRNSRGHARELSRSRPLPQYQIDDFRDRWRLSHYQYRTRANVESVKIDRRRGRFCTDSRPLSHSNKRGKRSNSDADSYQQLCPAHLPILIDDPQFSLFRKALRKLPQLHLVERTNRDGESVAPGVISNVGRLKHVVRNSSILSIAKQSNARVVPARNHEPAAAQGLDAVELPVPLAE